MIILHLFIGIIMALPVEKTTSLEQFYRAVKSEEVLGELERTCKGELSLKLIPIHCYQWISKLRTNMENMRILINQTDKSCLLSLQSGGGQILKVSEERHLSTKCRKIYRQKKERLEYKRTKNQTHRKVGRDFELKLSYDVKRNMAETL